MPADAGGEVGRTNAVARFAREELFDDPILERVKGDDRDPASGAEDAHRAFERHREVRELVIHRDAERLEDPRGRIDAPRTAGLHARDEAAELVSGPEGRLGAAADDPEELSARPASFEDGRGVASGADRPVEVAARFMGIELGEYFGEKNRLMCESGGSALRPPNNRIPTRSRGP